MCACFLNEFLCFNFFAIGGPNFWNGVGDGVTDPLLPIDAKTEQAIKILVCGISFIYPADGLGPKKICHHVMKNSRKANK